MYTQVPVALKKTMNLLHKFVVQHAQNNLAASKLQHSASAMHMPSQALPPSASFNPHSPPAAGGRSGGIGGGRGGGDGTGGGGGAARGGGLGDSVFTGTLHIMDELLNHYIPLKITLVQHYQNLNLACAPGGGGGSSSSRGFGAARVREVHYSETVVVLEELRYKCDRSFTHPWMVRLKDALILPELFLLERCLALESQFRDAAILPALDWKATMFALMRIKTEHVRWLNRLMARDRDGAPGGGGGGSGGAGARKPAGGAGAPAKFSPLLPVTPSTVTFPCVLHWVHQLHHSLLCKATLLFWTATAAKSAEIKGFGDEAAAKVERLDSNYVAQMDRMVRRLPHCYSVALIMDCTDPMHQGLRVPDPAQPLLLHDSALSPDDLAESASAAVPDGLGKYPVLLSRPPHRPVLEKWNLVSLLQQKEGLAEDMAAAFAAAAAARRPPPLSPHAPQQSATQMVALGPSNSPSDLLVWDYENEALQASHAPGNSGGGSVPAGTVSTFLCKVDPSKNLYLVVTFQAGCTNNPAAGTDLLSPSNPSRESSGSDAAAMQSTINAVAAAGTSASTPVSTAAASATTPSHASSASSGLSSPLPPYASASASLQLLSAAARKRAFEQVLAEVTPMLHKLRHMHVFANLQPALGKKRS